VNINLGTFRTCQNIKNVTVMKTRRPGTGSMTNSGTGAECCPAVKREEEQELNPTVKRETGGKGYNPATESTGAQGRQFSSNSETGNTTRGWETELQH